MKKQLFEFVQFSQFYHYYKPLTPYGKSHKNRMALFTDSAELQKEYEHIAIAVAFIKENHINADMVEYHLSRIPQLESLESSLFDSTDLFQIKKFLINFSKISSLLSTELKKAVELTFSSEKLLNLFLKGGKSETFHIADSYSKDLKKVREQLKTHDKTLQKIKDVQLQKIKTLYSYDFSYRDFIVTPEATATDYDKEMIFIEPYDRKNVIIKPVLPEKWFALHKEREKLVSRESKIEQAVRAEITTAVHKELPALQQYISQVEIIDRLIAKAQLTIKFNMKKPTIKEKDHTISITNGRYIPQVEKCEELKTKYFPLSVTFDNRIIVINGSNMGGKTVLLQSIGFFQLLSQMGFFVPADHFETSLFSQIFYIGEYRKNRVEGLSSFGMEIHNFQETFKTVKSSTLYLIDEFARTTNSHEAVALIAALLTLFSQKDYLSCFLSTHFMELPTLKHLSFYKMKGLNYDEYEKYYKKEHRYDLRQRIRLINSFMEYDVVRDDQRTGSFDALSIAQILGLDKKIIDYSYNYLGGNNEE